jgi:NAD(P)H-hydrate epimerase
VTREQWAILERLGVPITVGVPALVAENAAVVDGMIGYSLAGPPRAPASGMIEWANDQHAPVVALDVPSGLDATTGDPREPTIRATATMTLALPKTGLAEPGATPLVGELYLADIGVPPQLYASPSLGLCVGPLFSRDEILRLR